ncbi:MAG: cytochrome c [Anaerolineae bacterium]|nr:MAG: cytochrome c [Anaerolineae bacterium]
MRRLLLLSVFCLSLLVGCGGDKKSEGNSESRLDPNTDAGRGEQVFKTYCATCHAIKGDRVVVGPSLEGIATRAATRIEGLSAEDYIRESILYPNDFTVPNFAEGMMQQNFASQLTSDDVNYLVAYLMTLD